jgi:hypothetical protein
MLVTDEKLEGLFIDIISLSVDFMEGVPMVPDLHSNLVRIVLHLSERSRPRVGVEAEHDAVVEYDVVSIASCRPLIGGTTAETKALASKPIPHPTNPGGNVLCCV